MLLSVPLERIKQYEAYFRVCDVDPTLPYFSFNLSLSLFLHNKQEISKKEQNEAIKANINQVLECLAGLSTAAAEANNQAKIKNIHNYSCVIIYYYRLILIYVFWKW